MTTQITLDDGRVLGFSNGGYDLLLEVVAKEVARVPEDLPGFSEWLLEQRCEVCGPGVGSVDTRTLSPIARRIFRNACSLAHETCINKGDSTEGDPEYLPRWIARFKMLLDMYQSIDRGEPPEALMDENWKVGPVMEGKCGPGW